MPKSTGGWTVALFGIALAGAVVACGSAASPNAVELPPGGGGEDAPATDGDAGAGLGVDGAVPPAVDGSALPSATPRRRGS